MEWSNCGKIVALGGFTRLSNLQCQNEIHFYTSEGTLLHQCTLPTQVWNYFYWFTFQQKLVMNHFETSGTVPSLLRLKVDISLCLYDSIVRIECFTE